MLKTATLGVGVTINHVAMVTNLQMLAYFLNSLSIKHYLVQFWAPVWASTANIKCTVVLQTFRQSENESKFQRNCAIFYLNIPLRSLYCNSNCSNMLLWSSVIQITQIRLFTNSHFLVINWKPHIDIFLRQPPCVNTIWQTEVKSYNSCTHSFSDSRDTYLIKNTMRIIHPRWYRPPPLVHELKCSKYMICCYVRLCTFTFFMKPLPQIFLLPW